MPHVFHDRFKPPPAVDLLFYGPIEKTNNEIGSDSESKALRRAGAGPLDLV